MTGSPTLPMERHERSHIFQHQQSEYASSEGRFIQAWKQWLIWLDAKTFTNAIGADQHETSAAHGSFLCHDQARAVAAARVLMRMRHGPTDTATTICQHGGAGDRASIIVIVNKKGGKQHIRLRWSVKANGRKHKIHIVATRKRRTTDESNPS